MQINLYILKASGRLNIFEPLIKSAFEKGLSKIREKISLPDVDVIVMDNVDAAIPETGVGGFAPTAHLLYISINPNFSDLQTKLEYEIQSTLAHELHHCARWEAVGYGKTLLEAIVSEGLADLFDIEVNGGEPKLWSVAVRGKELEKLKEKAKFVFNKTYNEQEWFFGAGDVPKWAAYSLGFNIVGHYVEKTGKSASELVGEEAGLFIK